MLLSKGVLFSLIIVTIMSIVVYNLKVKSIWESYMKVDSEDIVNKSNPILLSLQYFFLLTTYKLFWDKNYTEVKKSIENSEPNTELEFNKDNSNLKNFLVFVSKSESHLKLLNKSSMLLIVSLIVVMLIVSSTYWFVLLNPYT